MSTMRNSVQLIGRPGIDPEVKKFDATNRVVARFTLATNDYYYNQKNERVDETQWHNIVAWGKTAELVEKRVRKGREIALEGKLTTRYWEDKDGNKRQTVEVVMNEFLVTEKE